MLSKWLYGICYCLLVVVTATVASGQGLSVNSIPNSGLVQPITPEMTGSAGAMSSSCPAGQALTQIGSNTYTCQYFEGGSGNIPPGTVNQILGWDNNNNPENQTVGGGNGNCLYTRTNANYSSITCSNYATYGGGQFTGTIASPVFYVSNAAGTSGSLQAPPTAIYYQPGYGAGAQGQWNVNGIQGLPALSLGAGTPLLQNSINLPPAGSYFIGGNPLSFNEIYGDVTDAQLANGYSGVGACTSGSFVTGLQRNGAPVCLPVSTNYAPLTNPTGGQNNYAPLSNPTFTSAASSPIFFLTDGTGGIMSSTSAGIALGGSTLRPNSINLPAGGQYLINDVPISGGGGGGAPLVNPAGGQNNYAAIASPQLTGDMTLTSSTSGFLLNSNVGVVGSITTAGSASGFLGVLGGAHYAGGGSWIADSTGPTGIVQNGQIGFYGGTGTTGSAWNPTLLGSFTNSGLTMATGTSITTPGLTVNGNANITGVSTLGTVSATQVNTVGATVTNSLTLQSGLLTAPAELLTTQATTGNSIYMGPSTTSPYATFLANSTSGYDQGVLSVGAHSTGTWIADSSNALITQWGGGSSSTPPAIVDYIDTGLTVGNTFTPTLTMVRRAPGGTLPTVNINNWNSTGLEVGDAFLSSTGTAVFNLSSGTYYTGSQWIANSTASGYVTVAGSPSGMSVYIAGSGTAGSVAPAGVEMQRTDVNGVKVSHMYGNLAGFIPSIANGTPLGGDNDSFGFINASAWPVTITFGHAFVGTSACVATALENGATMYIGGNSTTSMQFGCFGVGGGPCGPIWFTYHCFGVG